MAAMRWALGDDAESDAEEVGEFDPPAQLAQRMDSAMVPVIHRPGEKCRFMPAN